MEIRTAPILRYLERTHPEYFGKIIEMRREVKGWLGYIPHTFPHYTRHTIEHSEEIIHQISSLLFRPENPTAPTIPVSSTELYILVAAAYLHDAGMVASDQEKATLLASEEWNDWIGSGGGGEKRNSEIDAFLAAQEIADSQTRRFLADVQRRFLIAEFIRQRHHLRAADVVKNYENALGRFSFGDSMLASAISDICVAHGLHRRELEDKERFPEERDIRHDKVNVRFLAILLRLGDLLDVSHDRACPLLLNAAAPIPIDSYPHWSQYRGIYHRRTNPDIIEISARCESQEDHRALYDWCKWIEEEVSYASVLMAHAPRHRSWAPPVARLDDAGGTIQIKPAPQASYKFTKWQLELDQTLIFGLLINDLYAGKHSFLRELIQNALDAMRCQLFLDLQENGKPIPECLSHVENSERSAYGLAIELFTRPIINELSGEMEVRQVIAIDDCGIGMNRDVIERFFLQVGRSFYTTPEFRRKYSFHPTSKFGIGFLSVFQVSDNVIVDTNNISNHIDGSLRLTLTGPRNYLLTEKSLRAKNGTRIELILRKGQEFSENELTTYVTELCKRVEFPILVNDLGSIANIEAEGMSQFICESQSLEEEEATFGVRGFPMTKPHVDGEIYVFYYKKQNNEEWNRRAWAKYSYLPYQPRAELPELPNSLRCLHGLTMGSGFTGGGGYSYRFDYRGAAEYTTASRESARRSGISFNAIVDGNRRNAPPDEVADDLAKILSAHLDSCPSAKGAMGWIYKQSLVDDFPFPNFWEPLSNTLRVFHRTTATFTSLAQLMEEANVVVLLPSTWHSRFERRHDLVDSDYLNDLAGLRIEWDTPSIIDGDLRHISRSHRHMIFNDRRPREVFTLTTGQMAVIWEKEGQPAGKAQDEREPYHIAPLKILSKAGRPIFAVSPHLTREDTYRAVIFNTEHPFVQWMNRVHSASLSGRHNVSSAQISQILEHLKTPLHHHGFRFSTLEKYLIKWNEDSSLPSDLVAPRLTVDDLLPEG